MKRWTIQWLAILVLVPQLVRAEGDPVRVDGGKDPGLDEHNGQVRRGIGRSNAFTSKGDGSSSRGYSSVTGKDGASTRGKGSSKADPAKKQPGRDQNPNEKPPKTVTAGSGHRGSGSIIDTHSDTRLSDDGEERFYVPGETEEQVKEWRDRWESIVNSSHSESADSKPSTEEIKRATFGDIEVRSGKGAFAIFVTDERGKELADLNEKMVTSIREFYDKKNGFYTKWDAFVDWFIEKINVLLGDRHALTTTSMLKQSERTKIVSMCGQMVVAYQDVNRMIATILKTAVFGEGQVSGTPVSLYAFKKAITTDGTQKTLEWLIKFKKATELFAYKIDQRLKFFTDMDASRYSSNLTTFVTNAFEPFKTHLYKHVVDGDNLNVEKLLNNSDQYNTLNKTDKEKIAQMIQEYYNLYGDDEDLDGESEEIVASGSNEAKNAKANDNTGSPLMQPVQAVTKPVQPITQPAVNTVDDVLGLVGLSGSKNN